jgi:hypothetical protein
MAAATSFPQNVSAQESGDTDVTFAILGGGLSINVPASADLGTVESAATVVDGQLGVVTVTDNRGSINAAWTTSVSSTNFTTDVGGTNEVVASGAVTYSSGPAVSTTGTGTFVGQPGDPLDVERVAAEWNGGIGNNQAAWNPTLTLVLSPQLVAGPYSGTVTHSVA